MASERAKNSLNKCKQKKPAVVFTMALVESHPVRDGMTELLCERIRCETSVNELYCIRAHQRVVRYDMVMLQRILRFKGETDSTMLGFFAGARFLALLCVNSKGMYIERHAWCEEFSEYAFTDSAFHCPPNVRAVNFWSWLNEKERKDVLDLLYSRGFLDNKLQGNCNIGYRIARTLRQIYSEDVDAINYGEIVKPIFRNSKTISDKP